MATVVEHETCEGFAVESPERLVGWVERAEPDRLIVRIPDGRLGVLPASFVQSVDPDAQEVLVGRDAELMELGLPDKPRKERPVWVTILLALGVIAVIACAQMGADFLVARLVTGHWY